MIRASRSVADRFTFLLFAVITIDRVPGGGALHGAADVAEGRRKVLENAARDRQGYDRRRRRWRGRGRGPTC